MSTQRRWKRTRNVTVKQSKKTGVVFASWEDSDIHVEFYLLSVIVTSSLEFNNIRKTNSEGIIRCNNNVD